MRHLSRVVIVGALALLGTTGAEGQAQVSPPGSPPQARAGRGALTPRAADAARAQMERRLQERINQVVRQRLNLNDEQMGKLRGVATHIEDDRRVLRNEEMTSRFALRQELLGGAKADEARVAGLLDKLSAYERRRLDLMDREQKELAKFLSPTQRARYVGLQEELRRSMQEVQRRRATTDSSDLPLGGRRQNRPPP